MSALNKVIELFRVDYQFLERDLSEIQRDLEGEDTDVRLCVDFDGEQPTWIIRTGDASYDQRHSAFCGASIIDHDVNPNVVLEELIDQVCDQAAEADSIKELGAK